MRELIDYAKCTIRMSTTGTIIGFTVLFVECFWALIYTITRFWSWGHFIEEIGLIYAAWIVSKILYSIGMAFYELYKESEMEKMESTEEEP